jgi:Cys-tRNA(Pro) deacylase
MSETVQHDAPAIQYLRRAGVAFTVHCYMCEEGSSTTEACAKALGVDEHSIVKTIVLEGDGKPLIVLMHGDMRASVKELAKVAGLKAILPCSPDKARAYTGYEVGGISPFGTYMKIPVYMEETILNLRKVYINGGRGGCLVGIDPYDAVKILNPTLVKVGSARGT